MVSSSFFVTFGWRVVIAALAGRFFTMSAPGIAVSRQIDVRPPVYTPGFVDNRGASAASPGASAARDFVLDGPRFQCDGIIA
jgi:hypothetical protein